MIAQFDSNIRRVSMRGDHDGTPRVWVVQVRADDLDEVITFRPKGKVYIQDLADLIDKELIAAGVKDGRVRWTATAR